MIPAFLWVYWIFCAVAFALLFIYLTYRIITDYRIACRNYMIESDKHSLESPRNVCQKVPRNRSRKKPSTLYFIPEESNEYSIEMVWRRQTKDSEDIHRYFHLEVVFKRRFQIKKISSFYHSAKICI